MCSAWWLRGSAPWPAERFAAAVARNISIAGVLAELKAGVSGTNYRRVHHMVRALGLDTSHWRGRAHLRGRTHRWTQSQPLASVLVERSTYINLLQLKKRLVAEGVLPYRCAMCGIDEWRGRRIVLQLDHINGIGDDHRIDNIRLLCPNCHSQTDTFCGRNMRKCRERDSNPHGVSPTAF